MDIYVKELPKSCYECSICYTDESTDRLYTRCSLINDTDILGRDMNVSKHIDKRHKKCPLKSLKEYNSELCNKIKEKSIPNYTLEHRIYTYSIEPHKLEQIEKGEI